MKHKLKILSIILLIKLLLISGCSKEEKIQDRAKDDSNILIEEETYEEDDDYNSEELDDDWISEEDILKANKYIEWVLEQFDGLNISLNTLADYMDEIDMESKGWKDNMTGMAASVKHKAENLLELLNSHNVPDHIIGVYIAARASIEAMINAMDGFADAIIDDNNEKIERVESYLQEYYDYRFELIYIIENN